MTSTGNTGIYYTKNNTFQIKGTVTKGECLVSWTGHDMLMTCSRKSVTCLFVLDLNLSSSVPFKHPSHLKIKMINYEIIHSVKLVSKGKEWESFDWKCQHSIRRSSRYLHNLLGTSHGVSNLWSCWGKLCLWWCVASMYNTTMRSLAKTTSQS